jgi:hypothetical protein
MFPDGERVKRGAVDAAHLALLLHLGQITSVTVPTAEQEAARDLVGLPGKRLGVGSSALARICGRRSDVSS